MRLIPARAGNTSVVAFAVCSTTAHPRSRGEHYFSTCHHRAVGGSSPLARGTQIQCWGILSVHPAHPRSRGEHFSMTNKE